MPMKPTESDLCSDVLVDMIDALFEEPVKAEELLEILQSNDGLDIQVDATDCEEFYHRSSGRIGGDLNTDPVFWQADLIGVVLTYKIREVKR